MSCYGVDGRLVPCNDDGSLAIGLYFYGDDEIPENNPCGALRPGFLVVNHNSDGSGVINICNGSTTTGHLPDVYLADDPWKPYIQWGLLAACAIMAVTVFKQAVK